MNLNQPQLPPPAIAPIPVSASTQSASGVITMQAHDVGKLQILLDDINTRLRGQQQQQQVPSNARPQLEPEFTRNEENKMTHEVINFIGKLTALGEMVEKNNKTVTSKTLESVMTEFLEKDKELGAKRKQFMKNVRPDLRDMFTEKVRYIFKTIEEKRIAAKR